MVEKELGRVEKYPIDVLEAVPRIGRCVDVGQESCPLIRLGPAAEEREENQVQTLTGGL